MFPIKSQDHCGTKKKWTYFAVASNLFSTMTKNFRFFEPRAAVKIFNLIL